MLYLSHNGCVFAVTPGGTIAGPSRQTPQRITGAHEAARNGRGCTREYAWADIARDPDAIPWFWENGRQRTFLHIEVNGVDIARERRVQNTWIFQHEEETA